MTVNVAYFVDGPFHTTHAELPKAEHIWKVAQPNSNLRAVPLGAGLPDVCLTIRFGEYERSHNPELYNDSVNVWRYIWKGWQ